MAQYDIRVRRCKYCDMTFSVVVRCPGRRFGPCIWDGKPVERKPEWIRRQSENAKDFTSAVFAEEA